MDNKERSWSHTITMLVVSLLTLPLLFGLNMFVIRDLWNWFVTPITDFNMTLPHAAGLVVIISYLGLRFSSNTKKNEKVITMHGYITRVSGVVFSLLLLWGVGSVVHSFM